MSDLHNNGINNISFSNIGRSSVDTHLSTSEENEEVKLLNAFLIDLSNTDVTKFSEDDQKKELDLKKLEKIYEKGFRHLYSEIFRCMIDFGKDIKEGSRLHNLNFNMKSLYDYTNRLDADCYNDLGKSYNPDLNKKVAKLYDHIALEFSRIAYWVSNKEEIDNQLSKTKKTLKNMKTQSADLIVSVNNAKKEAENLKTSQVAVLGVFISILMGLISQAYIVGQSLSNIIDKSNLGALLILIIVASVCTITAVLVLLYIVGRIIGKDIFPKCPNLDDSISSDNIQYDDCNILRRLKCRLPYLYGFYQLVTVLLLFVIVFFYIPWSNILDFVSSCFSAFLEYLNNVFKLITNLIHNICQNINSK